MSDFDQWKEKCTKTEFELDKISKSFCLAKWLQVTINLEMGSTQSCHHPEAHFIELDEIKDNPNALHNTQYKKEQRKLMLEGKRPSECQYCWNFENTAKNETFSDRIIKSSDYWSLPYLDSVKNLQWDSDIDPKFLEVNLGYKCNLKCAYCDPVISSAIYEELEKFGDYPVDGMASLEYSRSRRRDPKTFEHKDIFKDAFWSWLPRIINQLDVLRITGGEPLLSPDLNKLLNLIKTLKLPQLDLGINTNLSVKNETISNLFNKIEEIVQEKRIKTFILFTSIDTYGKHAEYVRHGLNSERLWKSSREFIKRKLGKYSLMCTLNAFSPPNLNLLLKEMLDLKKLFYETADQELLKKNWLFPEIDISILNFPEILSIKVLPDRELKRLNESLSYMNGHLYCEERGFGFIPAEINKLERIISFLNSNRFISSQDKKRLQGNFYKFVNEYDRRKGVSLIKEIPQYQDFLKEIGTNERIKKK